MGGNVFKDSIRINTELAKETIFRITSILDGFKLNYIPWHYNKSDHGDIDFIVEPRVTPIVLKKKLPNLEIVNNGNISSVNYNKIQLDFIRTPAEYYDFAYRYYSYNDLGNLIGRITRNLGFKFGFKGLFYLSKIQDNYPIEDIKVNISFEEALHLFGFDVKKYQMGFYDLEDIFQYVYNSAYFDSNLFALEALDGENRRRNRKRKTYMSFLKWLETKPDKKLENNDFLKQYVLEDVYVKDQTLSERIKISKNKHLDLITYKNKFNGKLVSEYTGLKTIELGIAIRQLKKHLTKEKVLKMDDVEIENYIRNFQVDFNTKE